MLINQPLHLLRCWWPLPLLLPLCLECRDLGRSHGDCLVGGLIRTGGKGREDEEECAKSEKMHEWFTQESHRTVLSQ